MESWRKVWRDGIAPVLGTSAIESLQQAIVRDDPRLLQQATTCPPPLLSLADTPCEAADAIGWCGWQGEFLKTVGQVEEYFARVCFDCDMRLGEPAACRWFLNWFDDTPRGEVIRELLPEVELVLTTRMHQHETTPVPLAATPDTSPESARSEAAAVGDAARIARPDVGDAAVLPCCHCGWLTPVSKQQADSARMYGIVDATCPECEKEAARLK